MPRYAVILAIPGDPGPGKILSSHDHARVAEANLPALASAYVARRKPDGGWETRAEALARRGGKALAGAKPVLAGGMRKQVYLDAETVACALDLGGGVLSEGIRLAVKQAKGAR